MIDTGSTGENHASSKVTVLPTAARERVRQSRGRRPNGIVMLTGFSLGHPAPSGYGQTGFMLRASRIDRLYGHDDQVGPFARMVWDQVAVPIAGPPMANGQAPTQVIDSLRTSWPGAVHAHPDFVLLPLYHKIRIPFSLIHDAMLEIDALVENVRASVMPQVPRAEWDIYLTTTSDYKSSLRSDYAGTNIDVKQSLLADLPRFVWRVTVRTQDRLQLDFLFDATGIAQHDLLVHAASTQGEYAQMLAAVALFESANPSLHSLQAKALLKRFLVSPIPQAQGNPQGAATNP